MGTVFVAYGEPEHREMVLGFAAEQAGLAGHDLLVYHVLESPTEMVEEIREEVAAVVEERAPGTDVEVRIDAPEEASDRANVSPQKRLVDAVLAGEYEYVVMGDVERGSIEGLAHASMTEAVLETHAVPVLLVPV